MVYELRSWFGDSVCLFTDDQRLKDLALRDPDMSITSAYFRSPAILQPFAWDIVGRREVLSSVAAQFSAPKAELQTRRR